MEQHWFDWGTAQGIATYQEELTYERPGPSSYFIGLHLVDKKRLKGRVEVSISITLGNKGTNLV